MNNLKQILEMNSKKITTKNLIIYIFFAYIFSLIVRLFLFYQISDNSNFFHNGHIIPLWTPDTGLYGYYTKQLLNGVSYPFISEYTPAYLLYGVIKLTGIDVNSALFFAPAFLSSLIVIPIILIANHYKLAKYGLYGGIIGSLMTSYYYRTHLGYYDTDILNAFFPLLAIYFLIKAVDTRKYIDIIYASIVLIAFNFWYHSSTPIILATVLTFILYIAFFYREFIFKYKSYFLISFIAIVVFISLTDTTNYYKRAIDYINKESSIVVNIDNSEFKFKSDLDGVMEATGIDLPTMIQRVSGAIPYFILAIIGYLALIIKYRSMLLTLPIVGITFLSTVAGLRFTMYGVTLLSFSMVIGINLVFRNILVIWGEFPEKVSTIISRVFIFIVALFAINSVIDYNKTVSPIFFSSTKDITVLDNLKKEFKKDDFIISWWDVGWPLWYYLNTNNTLIDNGKHQQDNFIVSKILLSTNNIFVKNSFIFFTEKYREGQKKGFSKVMDYFLTQYPLEYINKLKNNDFKLPIINRDIYILLHKRMIFGLSNIESFSNIDLKTGKNYDTNIMNIGNLSKEYNKTQNILKTNISKINLKDGIVSIKNKKTKINKIYIVEDTKIKFEKKYYSSKKDINIIIYNGTVMLLTEKLFNSFLIQSLIFNNYNRDYFTKVAQTNNFIILKIKK